MNPSFRRPTPGGFCRFWGRIGDFDCPTEDAVKANYGVSPIRQECCEVPWFGQPMSYPEPFGEKGSVKSFMQFLRGDFVENLTRRRKSDGSRREIARFGSSRMGLRADPYG